MASNIKPLIYGVAIGTLATAYTIGLIKNQKEISDKIEPLANDFAYLVDHEDYKTIEKENGVTLFDYDGALETAIAAKNEFIKDNNLSRKRWAVGQDVIPRANTPTPNAYNPLKWSQKIDDSAVKAYFRNKFGNDYKTNMNNSRNYHRK